ncbi:MAG: Holliday junction resolvase RuvX [Rhizobiaceae bacterium]
MPVISVEELPDLIGEGATIAGLDLGTKTIGVAISDKSLKFAHPRHVIRRKKFTADAEKLQDCFRSANAVAAVIGLPLNMDGSESPRSQAARAFVRNFEKLSPTPFIFWDERLSTVAAERTLIEMDVSRQKRGERIDSAAATFILQGVLDRLQALRR